MNQMKSNRFSLKRQIKSFGHAITGFKYMWLEEHNFRIHVLAAFVVCFLGFVCHLSAIEWMFILFAIALVMGAEIGNSAIENVCDMISPEMDPRIKKIKDISAAWVLLSAIFALILAAFVFIPKLLF